MSINTSNQDNIIIILCSNYFYIGTMLSEAFYTEKIQWVDNAK